MKTHPFLQRFCVAGLFVVAMAHALVLTGQTNVSINATGAVAHPSAILDVSSTTSGLLLPRMTHAEKMAIATPTDGLMIYQIGGGDGIWYYDSSENAWVMLSRYLSGNVAMGDPPSVVMQGKGFTVTRLAVGTDEITLNEPMQYGPSVIMSSSQSDGSAPFLEDYCTPEFTTCGCHQILNFALYGGISAGATPIIENMASGCNGEPDMYKYYPPGDPVYVMSGSPDLCAGVADKYTLLFRGTVDNTACEVHRVYIWLDWQQDGFFDELNDQLVSTNTVDWGGGNQVLGNQTIPASAYSGDTFLRVMAIQDAPPNSCPGAADGETEEYSVHISCRPTAVYEDVNSVCNIGDITTTSFRVSCRRVGGEPRNVQNYYFQVNENDN